MDLEKKIFEDCKCNEVPFVFEIKNNTDKTVHSIDLFDYENNFDIEYTIHNGEHRYSVWLTKLNAVTTKEALLVHEIQIKGFNIKDDKCYLIKVYKNMVGNSVSIPLTSECGYDIKTNVGNTFIKKNDEPVFHLYNNSNIIINKLEPNQNVFIRLYCKQIF